MRASSLFHRGEGGPPDWAQINFHIRQIVYNLPDGDEPAEEEDPFLADLIWWKNGRYAVIEISLQVERTDVLRAALRAETLRRAGVEAMGVVIGEKWLADDTEELARARSVEWKVGNDLSKGFVAFRRQAV